MKYVRPLMTEERFWQHVVKSNGCWEWNLTVKHGYAHVSNGIGTPHGRTVMPHRAAYMFTVGPIPEGTELDHLCLNAACIRPDHLEAVSRLVNIRRACSIGRVERQDQCANGHDFAIHGVSSKNGKAPNCRQCWRDRSRRYSERKRSAK